MKMMTSTQEVLERILQYTPLQVVLFVLAIIDVAVVVSEILVTLHIYDSKLVVRFIQYWRSFFIIVNLKWLKILSCLIFKI